MIYYSKPIEYLKNLNKNELEELPYLQNLIKSILSGEIKSIEIHYPLIDFISRELELKSILHKDYDLATGYKSEGIKQLSKYQYILICFVLLSLYDLLKDLRFINTIIKFYDSHNTRRSKSHLRLVYSMSIHRLNNHH